MSRKTNKKTSTAPSFTFQWDTKSLPKAKAIVLARKKQKPQDTTKNLSTINATNTKTTTSKQTKLTIPINPIIDSTSKQAKSLTTIDKNAANATVKQLQSRSPSALNDCVPISHIKRKQKKDKLLAKQSVQEGGNGYDKTSSEGPNYNLFSVRHKDVYVNTTSGKSVSEKVFSTSSFKDIGIHPHLVSNLEKHGFSNSTNVQSKAIPVIVTGKNTLVRSQTGSGKTLAYAVPIIDALQGIQPKLKRTDGLQAIIVVPTRELALQVHQLFSKINTFQWLVVNHLCGGENRKTEKDRIKKGMNVVIGTPGRLLDHVLHTTAMKVDQVRCLVLDEADRLLDMGFRKDIVSLVEALDKSKSASEEYGPIEVQESDEDAEEDVAGSEDRTESPLKCIDSNRRQNIMLSATLTKAVSDLASFTMKDHVYIDALDMTSNAVADSYVIPDTVAQEFIVTHAKHRLFTLAALLLAKARLSKCKLFVFMASTQMVDFHYGLFSKHLAVMPANRRAPSVNAAKMQVGDDADDNEDEVVMDTEIFKLHGSMDQKERKVVFKGFRDAKKGILICTDVVARGIDVPAADCIVQYTGPQTDQDYLHRVGRTGRAGQSGSAIIFLTHEEQDYVEHLRTHRVFLQKRDPQEYLQGLSIVMEEPNIEQAATLLQRNLEAAVEQDDGLRRAACFAYSTWSRFYNTYSQKMRKFFDFKRTNLGHYVTSFALRSTPTQVARVVREAVADVEAPRLNKKLANHSDGQELRTKRGRNQAGAKAKNKLNKRTVSLSTSEFGDGLVPLRKRVKRTE